MNLADLNTASATDVAKLPVSVLAELQAEYAALSDRHKRIGNVLDMALQERYANGLNGPGTIHRSEDGFDIKVTAPKRVAWDRDGLEMLCDDPEMCEWVDWEPSVAESRYKAAPQRVKDALNPYRTEKMGKASVKISRKEEGK